MNSINKIFLLLLTLISTLAFSQDIYLVDFGATTSTTSGNWNNITTASSVESGMTANLISSLGSSSSIVLTVNDAFNYFNTTGTSSPTLYYSIPSTATQDSLFGNGNDFGGYTEPTGGFVLSGLDPAKFYSFSIFAARSSVSDIRDALYTITGSTTLSGVLNASNNTSNTAELFNIQPLANGTIVFTASVGPNNTSSPRFFYLGSIKLIVSNTPYTAAPDPESLSLIYPNGSELWEVGKAPFISWQSQSIANVTLEYSIDNGANWMAIATVPASSQKYSWTVPNTVSTQCKVRISSGLLSGSSTAAFSIIPNVGTSYKIVVVGSSTAAGTGPSSVNNAWVWKYRDYLTQSDTRYSVDNLALGGYTTYNILPTGTTIPVGVSQTIDLQRNITKALQLNPTGIIVNMPSNDTAQNYSAADQIANYQLIKNTANAQNVPLWTASPQPRNFGNASMTAIQGEVLNSMVPAFGDYTFDFWTTLALVNGDINPIYNADGVHLNNAGHQILFDRVVAKGIHTIVKSNVDTSLNIDKLLFKNIELTVFPNPCYNCCSISYVLDYDSIVAISIYDINGKLVDEIFNNFKTSGSYSIKWDCKNAKDQDISEGIYFCKIQTNKGTTTKKIIHK